MVVCCVVRPRVVNQRCFFPEGGCIIQYQSTSAQIEEFSGAVRLNKKGAIERERESKFF